MGHGAKGQGAAKSRSFARFAAQDDCVNLLALTLCAAPVPGLKEAGQ